MNASIISALAALVGAAIGGLTSVLASWLTQKTQARAQWGTHDKIGRQEVYKEIHRGRREMPWPRAPTRKSGNSRVGRTLRQDWQNARPVLARSRRQRRTNR